MPTKFEQFANNAATTLNGSINASVTTVNVNDGSVFPSNGNFHVIVGGEVMLVTARSSNALTVVRGHENTVAATHADLDAITLILTKESMERAIADYVPLYGAGTDLPGPQNSITNSSGTTLTSTDFTWNNQGTSTVTDQASGAITWTGQNTTGANLRTANLTPPSAPWTATACFFPQPAAHSTNGHCGMMMRENSTDKTYCFGIHPDNTIRIYKYTTATTYSGSDVLGFTDWNISFPLWCRVEDDNTDVKFYVSQDGLTFAEIGSETRTTFMAGGPDRVGMYLNNNSATRLTSVTLCHWSFS